MTVRAVTQTQVLCDIHGSGDGIAGFNLAWTGLLNGDSGAPVTLPGNADRTIQVTGTFGAGGSVAVEGSNDGVNYFALTNPSGTVIALTAAGGAAIVEAVQFVRPRVTAGDGTTSIAATMFCRNTQMKF